MTLPVARWLVESEVSIAVVVRDCSVGFVV